MTNSASFFYLQGANTSLVITNHESLPSIAWFGSRLQAEFDAEMLAHHDDAAHAFATLDARAPLSLFPQTATGFMGSNSLVGHRENSSRAINFSVASAQQTNQTIKFVLIDAEAKLELTQQINLDIASDVATITSSLKNTGDNNFNVDWLASATLPLPNHLTQCISQHGRWGLENQSYKRAIGPGRIDISNQHGRTGHEHAPNIICASDSVDVDNGDALFAHLGWSGNYSFRIERMNDGVGYLQAGVLLSPKEEVLAPGQSLDCPPLYFTKGNGLNECTQRFHRFARTQILPKWTRLPRLIHANSWEAMYFDLDDKSLNSLVDAAASIGAERFILDDGWFINRRDDTAGLGDWTVDKTVFPNGLTPLVKHVRSHNMQFGLWFEPEMVNPNSNLYREHPEWVLQFNEIETPLARNQLVLDVAREDVSNYLFNCISTLVDEYQIDYIKWDMNRDLVLAGDGNNYRASKQPEAVYALMRKLTTAHPNLEIESCSSGGARCDFGVLKETGRVWTSDNIDPLARATIQQGFARFFPPEILGAHVGHLHAHLTGRSTNLHTRAIVALQGQYGFELDARVLDEEDKTVLRHYTELYKAQREWINNACYWELPSNSSLMIASGIVDEDQKQALFSMVLLDSLNSTRPGFQRFRGLKPTAHYKVELASSNLEFLKPFNRVMPSWCENSIVTSGELLMSIGLSLPVMPPQSALLVQCTEQTR